MVSVLYLCIRLAVVKHIWAQSLVLVLNINLHKRLEDCYTLSPLTAYSDQYAKRGNYLTIYEVLHTQKMWPQQSHMHHHGGLQSIGSGAALDLTGNGWLVIL